MPPDEPVLEINGLAPGLVVTMSEQAAAQDASPRTMSALLDCLRGQGLARSVAKTRALLGAAAVR